MKNIKKAIAAVTMMMVLMVGTSFAGIFVTNAQAPQPCTVEKNVDRATGLLLTDLTGIFVTTLTGIFVTTLTTDTTGTTDCGLIVTD